MSKNKTTKMIKKICLLCGKEFETKDKNGKYCSFDCFNKSRVGKKYLDKKGILPDTEKLYKRIIRLPLHNHLSIKDIDYVCKVIKKFYH